MHKNNSKTAHKNRNIFNFCNGAKKGLVEKKRRNKREGRKIAQGVTVREGC